MALRNIVDGTVGFDTEFTDRRPTREEELIIAATPAGAVRKYALLGWQIVELNNSSTFPVAWDNIGLRLVQIYRDGDAWVLDMWKIKAFPRELKRILESADIKKSGAGLVKDIAVIWDDIRMEMRNLVDVGFMEPARDQVSKRRLYQPRTRYLSRRNTWLRPKELATSDWSSDELSEEQIRYAAQDAVASLHLYNVLKPLLAQKSVDINSPIPSAWYTFNTQTGEPARVKKAADGSVIIWKTGDCTWYGGGKFIGYP